MILHFFFFDSQDKDENGKGQQFPVDSNLHYVKAEL